MRIHKGRVDSLQIIGQAATANLMTDKPGIQSICQGMIEAAENNTATSHRFQRRQAKTLTHTTTSPIVCGIIEIDLCVIE